MGKKRKSGRSSTANEEIGENIDVAYKRIRTYEDVANSDDEFHLNHDKVLLEEQPAAKRQRKIQEEEAFLQPSDEEILNDSEVDLTEDDLANASQEESADEEGWGTTRADVYGADAIETEEQAIAEEVEARRLQKKQLQSMSAADYGFEEDEWQDTSAQRVVTETLPEAEIPIDTSTVERLKLLRAKYPEFEPLSKELLEINGIVAGLAAQLQDDISTRPKALAKHNAATAYLAALTMYFALLTSGDCKTMPASELRDHDIMTTLVDCRLLWQRARNLPDDRPPRPQAITIIPEVVQNISVKAPKKSRKERHAEALRAAKEAQIAEKIRRIEADDFSQLLTTVQPKTNSTRSDLEESLTAAQASEKAKRKKSLRFYTSQIAQKVNKRGAAGRTAGGDDDIPHRERLRDRQARLNSDAEKRGLGDDLGGDSDAEDADQARQIRQQADEEDYYDMIAARTAKKKSDKIAYGEARKQAAEQGGVVVPAESVGEDGKRKITYAIEKNKGLTPHRRKDVRNPRVKKRKKFEEKTKKLATMKATYKGGEGRGGYGGELTGIKANLVKSIKL